MSWTGVGIRLTAVQTARVQPLSTGNHAISGGVGTSIVCGPIGVNGSV